MSRSNHAYAYRARVNGAAADTINGRNQVTLSGTTAIQHDANGNIGTIGGAAYGYTSENRLAIAPGYYLPYYASGHLWELYNAATGEETMFEYTAGDMISEPVRRCAGRTGADSANSAARYSAAASLLVRGEAKFAGAFPEWRMNCAR